jgi:hypothetical protein
MRRRGYLGALAGAASLLAGCSGRQPPAGDATETVTPVPVPAAESVQSVTDGGVDPAAAGDAHVGALAGGSATIGIEYIVRVDGEALDSIRILSTVEDGAHTYRRFDVVRLQPAPQARVFRGVWHEDGETVLRFFEEGSQLVYQEPSDFTPAPAAERFDRRRLVAALAAFDPAATPTTDGYRLAADAVARPERLPTVEGVTGGTEGRLSARRDADGTVPELSAAFGATADGDPASVTYRVAVADRGSTSVERPDAAETLEWYHQLQENSPIELVASTDDGDADEAG